MDWAINVNCLAWTAKILLFQLQTSVYPLALLCKPCSRPGTETRTYGVAVLVQLYTCTSFPTAVSARLTVTSLPNLLFENNGGVHNVVQQSVIQLYCMANSTTGTTPNVTWTKNGVELVNDLPHIRIRNSVSANEAYTTSTSSLVVDNFQTSDNGSYMCRASDGMVTMNGSTLSLIGM